MSNTTKRSRGRPPGIKLPEEHRGKIKSAAILNALQEHVLGAREMGATQIQAAGILLKKVLPDLAHSTLAGDQNQPVTVQRIVTGVVRHTDLAIEQPEQAPEVARRH